MKNALSLSGMERLLKKAGAERVSNRAKEEFREIIEDYGEQIGKKAVLFANHSKRKTIKVEDIKLANKS